MCELWLHWQGCTEGVRHLWVATVGGLDDGGHGVERLVEAHDTVYVCGVVTAVLHVGSLLRGAEEKTPPHFDDVVNCQLELPVVIFGCFGTPKLWTA